MATHEKRMLDREAVRSVIQQWNANRLDLFALSEPDENLLFHGVMRFYFQDAGQKVATKCIRVASDATVSDVIETLIEKFRPDMRMLSLPNYALYEVHANGEERKLNPDEKPLLVQLNWHIDDREGRFLLRNIDQKLNIENADTNFKRKLSKREKKEQKKREKLAKLNSDGGDAENHVAEKLYTELPETSFTRSISNPEAVMRRRRQQKLEKKLQQFRSRDGGPDTGGTLKIYGESLCRDVPYKTLLLSIRDCAQAVVREMLSKYGLDKADPIHYCLVQVNSDGTEYILDDDECPLSILMNHPTSRGSIMFHVRRRPADSQPRRRKKKPLGVSNGSNSMSNEREGPMLVEVTHSGDGGRRMKLGSDPVEVGSANTNTLQLFGPSIQARHCLISLHEGVCTVTPLHADALTFVNGHHIQQPTVLHNGSVVMFGRVASYRFVDSPSDGRYNLALSQSQLDSACLYESRSPISPWNEEDRALSPINSINQGSTQGSKPAYMDSTDSVMTHNRRSDFEKMHHNNIPSVMASDDKTRNNYMSQAIDGVKVKELDINTNADLDNNADNETKSISSNKSSSSNHDTRHSKMPSSSANDSQGNGQEPILPAVLEFPEAHQEAFLRQVITELDVNIPTFKLAPVYTLYLCARYRASTHYRPDLQPTERAHKLTIFLHHVSNLIYNVVQDQYTDPRILAFWMANSSEFLHFLKSDRHISAFSVQAQEVLAESVQTAFRNLVNCFRVELSQTLNQFLSENIDHDSAAGLVLTVLGSAMALLRRCRVNAALTIQLFSQLFHYINVICFNTIVANSHMCTAEWGKVMTERLQLLELWAERQGLELAADCHLAKINQCAQFLQAPKTTVEEVQQLACSCFRLNSLQMAALLQQEKIPRNLSDTAIRMAESVADELTRADGREVRLEESPELHLALLLPDDGFSCDVVRGIPSGLVDFLNHLQAAGMCRLAAQPTSVGLWTVYMHQFNVRSPSAMSNKLPQPELQVIKLHKNSNGMGLSIVAAKGAGQERLGIYIKSVVPGGAADADGRLQAGDQLLRVDGQSLIGITQERAADYLVRTGPVVTLEVAKQGAIYHGLATLLQQPSPVIQREMDDSLEVMAPNLNYLSDSEESLSKYINESVERYSRPYSRYAERQPPPSYLQMRRRSSSPIQHELFHHDQELHIDPRYRDTRPIARSSSNLALATAETNYCRWDTNPSIYIEQYNDEKTDAVEVNSTESLNNTASYSEAHQPLNEDSIASCADSDDIPFIDDGSPSDQDNIYVPPQIIVPRNSKAGIMVDKSSTSRRSSSGCRKTVSFDLLDYKDRAPNGSDYVEYSFNKSKTCSVISDARLESFVTNTNDENRDHLAEAEGTLASSIILSELKVELPRANSMSTKPNNERSVHLPAKNKRLPLEAPRRQVFLRKYYSSSELASQINDVHCKEIEGGRVKALTKYFEEKCSNDKSISQPELSTVKQDKLNDFEREQILAQLKEWSLHGTKGRDIYKGEASEIDFGVDKNRRTCKSNRRMSERDLSRMGGDTKSPMPVPPNQHLQNSKSVPTLHHVGNLGMPNKSRSIHNLANNNEQGFYQNLSVYRAQNQSHPALVERPSILSHQSTMNATGGTMTMPSSTTNLSNQSTVLSRPVSAYYNSNNTLTNTLPSNSYIANSQQGALNNSINENISSNNQPQYQTMQMGSRVKGSNGFLRENQTQQSLRINQMMAPSMPNIANSIGYATNISASQSMQNVNMMAAQHEIYHHNPYIGNNSSMTAPGSEYQQRLASHQSLSHLRGQAKMAEMSEMINRRNQRQDQGITSMDLQAHNQLTGPSMQHSGLMSSIVNKQNVSMSNPQTHPMSPLKQLPPTAPKPILNRHQHQPSYHISSEDTSPPLPPSATHPLFKTTTTSGGNINYIASSLDPPKVAYYPVASGQMQPKNFVGANPWEREEREKEHELRREQVRHWRDQQIADLSSLQQRTPQQEEQLKTLVLERDFERRALEVEDPEDDGEAAYTKDNIQEVIRLSNQPITTPVTSMKQVDVRNVPPPLTQTQHSPSASDVSPSTPPMAEAQQSLQGYPIQQSQIVPTPTVQPKSILKNNRYDGSSSNTPSSPSKSQKSTSFADERRLQAEHSILQLSKEISTINLSPVEADSNFPKAAQSNSDSTDQKLNVQHFQPKEALSEPYTQSNNVSTAPPPPPERNSSYVVMSQQQKYRSNNLLSAKAPISSPLEHSLAPKRQSLNMNNNILRESLTTTSVLNNSNGQHSLISTATTISSSNTSSIGRDGKRVSFHDEENNLIPPQEFMGDKSDLDMIREDPDKFLEETTAILQTPTTPDAEIWNTSVQHTPGVIGAQEVYRDPRQRRLQEQQQKQQQKSGDGVPEKLSFKEKMKMFALESGENQTPKDKLKISRAQRDIDAVH